MPFSWSATSLFHFPVPSFLSLTPKPSSEIANLLLEPRAPVVLVCSGERIPHAKCWNVIPGQDQWRTQFLQIHRLFLIRWWEAHTQNSQLFLSRWSSRLLGARWLSPASRRGWKQLLPYQTSFSLSQLRQSLHPAVIRGACWQLSSPPTTFHLDSL